ncbi:hypothetical protein FRC03_012777 [Tulasnella sp. 419]|nr:hypothetical protein FRC03_012777 [Tulasnella sp. 419]
MARHPPSLPIPRFIMELAALIPHRSDSPLPSPLTTSSKGNKRQIFTLVGVAATVRILILVNVLWGGINTTEAVSRTPVVKHQSHESETAVIYAPGLVQIPRSTRRGIKTRNGHWNVSKKSPNYQKDITLEILVYTLAGIT